MTTSLSPELFWPFFRWMPSTVVTTPAPNFSHDTPPPSSFQGSDQH